MKLVNKLINEKKEVYLSLIDKINIKLNEESELIGKDIMKNIMRK